MQPFGSGTEPGEPTASQAKHTQGITASHGASDVLAANRTESADAL